MADIASTSKHLNEVSMNAKTSGASNQKGRTSQSEKGAPNPPQDKYTPNTAPSGPSKKIGLGG